MVVIACINIHTYPDTHGQMGQGSTFSWPDPTHAPAPVVLECLCQRTHGWRSHSSALLGRQVGQTGLVRAAPPTFPKAERPHICLSSSQCERNPCPRTAGPAATCPRQSPSTTCLCPPNPKTPITLLPSGCCSPSAPVGRGPNSLRLGSWVGASRPLRDAAPPPDWELDSGPDLEGLRRWRWMSTCPNTWTAVPGQPRVQGHHLCVPL